MKYIYIHIYLYSLGLECQPTWPWGMMWDVGKIKIHFVFFVLPKKPKSKKSIFFEGRTVSRIAGTSLFLCLNTTKCFFKKIF